MGKETSTKNRQRVKPPDEYVGRKAVDQGLISEHQLSDLLDRLDESSVPNQSNPSSLSAALVTNGVLTQEQVDALLETPPPPERMGRYKLGRKLGRGGMGVVYEAEDRDLGRKVAIKMLRVTSDSDPAELAEDEERFVREARFCAALPKHPNIVSVYEAGVLGDRRYIAMELIEGVQFQEWRDGKTTKLRQKISVLRDVALAVDHAHRHGVIHRDLKPANILIDAQSVPHVTDFGLAKQATKENGGSLTGSGFLLGTPAYVSPEQAQGAKDVDCRTDVWSLGIMLYEVLTGRLPFQGMNALDIVIKTIRDPISPPSTTRRTTLASTDKALETICMRALCKSPEDRYPSAVAMADDLSRWLEGRRVLATCPRSPRRYWKIGVAAALAASFLAFAIIKLSAPDESQMKADAAAQFVAEGKRLMIQNKPADALVAFGQALKEEPKNKAAAAGKKDAQDKLIASAKPADPKPAPKADPKPAAPAPDPDAPAGLEELAPLRGHENGVHLISFSPDGKSLVTGSFDRTIRLWDVAGRAQKKVLAIGIMPISAAVSRDGRWIAGGFLNGSLRVWSADGAERAPLKGHDLQVTGLAFTDGGLLASSSTDGTARLWDFERGVQQASTGWFPKGAMCLAISRDGRTIAVGSAERQVWLLDPKSWDDHRILDGGHEGVVRCAAFSPDGQQLATGSNEGAVFLTDVASGRRQSLSGHTQKVNAIAYSPDGQWVVTASFDATLRVWNARGGAPLGVIRVGEPVPGVAFSPDGRIMAVGVGNGVVRLWSTRTVTAAK
ncbi:MAG TPA: serine/threonine-protein kinase [Planctomycetota bacterium]|nr:serine/threonine-protein kinase [Planctomycetota bacterium]